MEFTTHISTPISRSTTLRTRTLTDGVELNGTITLYGAPFQEDLGSLPSGLRSQNYNSDRPKTARFSLGSSRFTRSA
jgi:hypothetical protein